MRKNRKAQIATAFDLGRLAMDSWMVVGLRLAKLSAGGPAAWFEAQRMVSEKLVAAAETQAVAALSLASGTAHGKIHRDTIRRYRRKVAANRRRLKRSG
jgi:hypothetical protein